MTSSPFHVLPVGLVGLIAGVIAACAHRPAATGEISQPVGSLAQMLAGRVSGAIVTAAPGGGIQVRISGQNSFYLSHEPLYVVDGVPVEPGPKGTLSWLNPEDVASIAVLRYEADTAIYGVRGANGVILIRTKGAH